MALQDIRYARGGPGQTSAGDGNDYLELLCAIADDMIMANGHMEGSASGMGTLTIDAIDAEDP